MAAERLAWSLAAVLVAFSLAACSYGAAAYFQIHNAAGSALKTFGLLNDEVVTWSDFSAMKQCKEGSDRFQHDYQFRADPSITLSAILNASTDTLALSITELGSRQFSPRAGRVLADVHGRLKRRFGDPAVVFMADEKAQVALINALRADPSRLYFCSH
ncbi:MAG TPA: hypothetical protein VFK84_10155 [Burkholderiales bacterium]|nr:hypothetical protein [Burkholderiales bacterium]